MESSATVARRPPDAKPDVPDELWALWHQDPMDARVGHLVPPIDCGGDPILVFGSEADAWRGAKCQNEMYDLNCRPILLYRKPASEPNPVKAALRAIEQAEAACNAVPEAARRTYWELLRSHAGMSAALYGGVAHRLPDVDCEGARPIPAVERQGYQLASRDDGEDRVDHTPRRIEDRWD